MTFKMPSLFAAAAILALAPTAQAAEPVTLDDTQLDAVTAGALPDIVIWDIDGGTGPGGPAGSSAGPGFGGSPYTLSALPDIVIWDIDGGTGPGGPAGSSAGPGFGGSPYTLSALPDIVIWDIDGDTGPGGPGG